MKVFSLLTTLVAAGAALGSAQDVIDDSSDSFPEDLNGSNFTYPWPVKLYKFTSQLQDVEMAFMDVKPSCEPNGKTAILFHGRNFCGATWVTTIRVLSQQGYRVIAPDQVGFCKSTKPERYQYSLQQLATNSHSLLETLGIDKVTVIGHSMGGMLTARYGLMYPDQIDEIVLVNPLGLEDYKALGVPYRTIDEHYKTEANSTYESIKAYEQATYYVGEWRDEYDVWVRMLVNIYKGSQREAFIRNQANVVDMVITQPIAWEFGLLKPRTLLIIGEKDNTAIGKQWSPPDVAAKLGRFDLLGPAVAAQIPNATLHAFPELGHSPQISHPEEFHDALVGWLSK
ncbi:alpha beta hydrolase fold protein [Colletotrichum sojae]|uniref:Alpha beta hydrolase fold protein n=1 Tax=Colletotrichum sojae TaxID=2175907 RepID=A0A8H6IQB8_9PEZI|nr:alpha beta hydrolase fold protein [Colletotrichum sojae]